MIHLYLPKLKILSGIRLFKILLCLFLFTSIVKAQYSLTANQPSPYFTYGELWNLTIHNSQTGSTGLHRITLIVHQNNQLAFTSVSNWFEINAFPYTVNALTFTGIGPVQTFYQNQTIFNQLVTDGGIFPPGNYRAAYMLERKNTDGPPVLVGETESDFTSESLFPPMLLLPTDGDSIETAFPVLTWTPAFSSVNSNITYDLRVVKIYNGQSPVQAVLANPTYYEIQNLGSTVLIYPPGAQPLDTIQSYAWQVTAKASSTILGTSEVWRFSLKKPPAIPVERIPDFYLKFSEKQGSDFTLITKPFLPIIAEEKYFTDQSQSFDFVIVNHKGQIVADASQFAKPIKTGTNKYLIPICSSTGNFVLAPGKYFIEIRLKNNNLISIPFEVSSQACNE